MGRVDLDGLDSQPSCPAASSPIVVESPCPVKTTVSAGSANSLVRIEAVIVS